IVEQEKVLNTSLVQKLDALILGCGGTAVDPEPVQHPPFRNRHRLRGPVVDHYKHRALGELAFHLLYGPLKHLRAVECRDRNPDSGDLIRLREPRRRKRRLRDITDPVNYNVLELDILAAGHWSPLAITSPPPRRVLPPRRGARDGIKSQHQDVF